MFCEVIRRCKTFIFILFRPCFSIYKNGWIDDKGRMFIYYSVKSVCEDLNCGTQKACKLLDELEKAGALERRDKDWVSLTSCILKKYFEGYLHRKNQNRRGVKITSENFD